MLCLRSCLHLAPPTHAPPEPCSSGQWTCDDGACIGESLRCDRKYDCPDGSDELHCGTSVALLERYFRISSPVSFVDPSTEVLSADHFQLNVDAGV